MNLGDYAGEIAAHDFKPGSRPQVAGGVGERGIDFDAHRTFNALCAVHRESCRVETAGADRRVGEADSLFTWLTSEPT